MRPVSNFFRARKLHTNCVEAERVLGLLKEVEDILHGWTSMAKAIKTGLRNE
jgi:hypothetical protein